MQTRNATTNNKHDLQLFQCLTEEDGGSSSNEESLLEEEDVKNGSLNGSDDIEDLEN